MEYKERKVILDLAVTLDGFIEGINGEVDWCIMDADMNFSQFLDRIDTILYGRKSYQLWGKYMPSEEVPHWEREIWEKVHSKKKVVFSRTLAQEAGLTLIKENIAEEIKHLKQQPGKDLWLYGGASLITTFMNLGLVDEYRISVHPVILGAGKPLFMDMSQRKELRLVEVNRFASGVVQLIYQSIEK